MRVVSYTCDNCGKAAQVDTRVNKNAEPLVSYKSYRYTDAAGGTSTASKHVHLCYHCARKWLSLILCGHKTVEQAREHFASKDKVYVTNGERRRPNGR